MSVFRVLTHAAGNPQLRAERFKNAGSARIAGKGSVGRGRGALTAPDSLQVASLKTMHTDHLDWSLPAHRRGDVHPILSSASVWSPIPYPEEIGREE
ncbi:hypothetical protein ABQ144_16150, partial [Xanthomonas hortorum pv. hederae]